MRKIYPPQLLTAVAALLLGLFSRIECQAQTNTWTGTAPATVANATANSDENTVFLYNVKTGKFLNRGGWWGVAAVLADNGIEFTVTKSGNGYIFNSKLLAQQSGAATDKFQETVTCLANIGNSGANQFVVDRSTSESSYAHNFTISAASNNQGYILKAGNYWMAAGKASNSDQFVNVDANTAISGYTTQPTDGSDVWKLVTLKERKQAFMKASNNTKTNVIGTFLIKDNDFSRRSANINSWYGGENALVYSTNTSSEGTVSPSTNNITYYQGNGGTGNYNEAYKWTGNVKGATGDLHQTINPFRHGWYEIRCRAFSTTSNGTPVLYASVGNATSKTTAKSEYAEAAITKITAPSTYVAANDEVNKTAIADGSTYYPYEVVVRVYVPETTASASEPETTEENGEAKYETCSTLTFGVKNSNGESSDWICADNFELEYLGEGNNNVVLDETKESVDYMNAQSKGVNSTIYINRSLTANKWNSILLPFDMTQNDIVSIFGSGTKISKYKGAEENDKTTIHFEATTTIEKGKLYLIKPTIGEPANQPAVASTATKSDDANTAVLSFEANSAYYTIPNIVYGSSNESETFSAQVTGDTHEVVAGGANYTFAGTYVKKINIIPLYSYRLNAASEDAHTGSTGNWEVNTASQAHSLGFRGWLQKAANSTIEGAAKLTFIIDGIEDDVTAIDGIEFDNIAVPSNNNVYNMNGQLIGAASQLSTLPRGLYIVNGKKVVVK